LENFVNVHEVEMYSGGVQNPYVLLQILYDQSISQTISDKGEINSRDAVEMCYLLLEVF
jgi:hypothetical protein